MNKEQNTKKRIIFLNIVIIMAIFLASLIFLKVFASSGNAATIDAVKTKGKNSLGTSAFIGYGSGSKEGENNNLGNRKDLYCIRHNSPMGLEASWWNVTGYIEVVGNNAKSWYKDSRGNIVNFKETNAFINGIIAKILSYGQGYGSAPLLSNGFHQSIYSDAQLALYAKIDSFMSKNGFGGYGGNPSEVYSQGAKTIISEAKDYAENIGNTVSKVEVNNNTNMDKVKVESYAYSDGKVYTRVGPINISFPGYIKEIYVTDQNNKKINPVWFSKYVGNEEKYMSAGYIESEKDFYITIENDGTINNIKSIGGILDVPDGLISAQIWILERSKKQNLLLADTSTKNLPGDFEMNLDITLLGDLAIEKVDLENNNKKLENVEFKVRNVATGKYISKVGKIVEYTDSEANAMIFKTDKEGKIRINNVIQGKYEFIEIENPNYGYRISEDPIEVWTSNDSTYYKVTNEQFIGNIGLEKVDEDSFDESKGEYTNKLQGVEFIVKYVDSGEYISEILPDIKEVRYTKNIDEAKVFVTDENGKIYIENVLDGTYQFIEKANPHYGYVISEEPFEVKTTDEIGHYDTMTNKQVYIKIGGFVWEDINAAKESLRNYRWKQDSDNYVDNADRRVSGVRVILKAKDENGNYVEVKETNTNENGEYEFVDIEIDKLSNYYVDFEYDGLIYQSVPDEYAIINGKFNYNDLENASIEREINGNNETLYFKNTSKAVEWHWDEKGSEYEGVRRQFNDNFANISNASANSINVDGKSGKYKELFYKYEKPLDETENGYRAIYDEDRNYCPIISSTQYLGKLLDIEGSKGQSTEKIDYINLGIYKRAQADLAVMKDLEQVKVAIKGYDHIYKYASRFDNQIDPNVDPWDAGVKFRNKYMNNSYEVTAYKADYNYENENDRDSEMKMYLTYRMVLRNESTINSRVNSIIDEYGHNYKVNAVGTGLVEETNEITGLLNFEQLGQGKIKIDTSNIDLNPVKNATGDIYVQFELSRQDVKDAVEKDIVIENKVEINSYTSYDEDGNLYAAVDIDSVPGNMNENYLEDDTDKAPNVGLELPKDENKEIERAVIGKVYEDEHDEKLLKDQNIREGNGVYNDGEATVEGVKVELLEKVGDNNYVVKQKLAENGGMVNIESITDGNGNYTLSGFEPGEYIVRFTWKDGIQKVKGTSKVKYENLLENYKATVFDKDRYEKENSNTRFYQEGFSEDLTHAIDNWEIRKEIDKQQNSHDGGENNGYNYATNVNVEEMISNTCLMTFPVEKYDEKNTGVVTNGTEKIEKYLLDKMSFGIIERAKQKLDFDKRVANVKVTLPDGRVLADAKIDNDGKLSGLTDYVTYTKPGKNGIRSDGLVKIEMDAELMQTSDLEIVYEYSIKNNSEADFDNKVYYDHGNKSISNSDKDNSIVRLTSSKIIDYLDSQNIFRVDDDRNIKTGWKTTTFDELLNSKIVKSDIFNGIDKKLFNCYITDKESSNGKIKEIAPWYVSDSKHEEEETILQLVSGKTLAPDSNVNFVNQVEIVEINKPFGSKIECFPGNYEPNSGKSEIDTALSEKVKVMKSTGGNGNMILMITTISIGLLVILGTGIYLIKKRAMNDKK